MKTLYLLRHAKAVVASPGGDAERPLAKRGRKSATAIGEFLGELRPAPELVLCSPAVRARETLDLVLPSLRTAPRVAFEKALYLAAASALLDRLKELPSDVASVLLVGHNPGLQELGARLARDPGPLAESFPTAALAAFGVNRDWADLGWRKAALTVYRTPEELSRDLDSD